MLLDSAGLQQQRCEHGACAQTEWGYLTHIPAFRNFTHVDSRNVSIQWLWLSMPIGLILRCCLMEISYAVAQLKWLETINFKLVILTMS